MKKLFVTISLLLFTSIIYTNVHALTCSIVDEVGNTITEAKAGDIVYLMDSYVNLKSGKLTWKLQANLPTIDSKNYKVLINNSGYYYHEGSSEDYINFTPIAIPAFAYVKGTAIISYTLSKAGKCSVPLYISEYVPPQSNKHTITATAGSNGSITPSGTVSVNEGDNQTFTVTSFTGYHIADVVVDNSSVGAVSSYTFNNITSDHTINATFTINATTGKTWDVQIVQGISHDLFLNASITTVPTDKSINITFTGVTGNIQVCYPGFYFVQGSNQVDLNKYSWDADTALFTPNNGWNGCSDIYAGVIKSAVISHLPSWFNFNAPFTFVFDSNNSFLLSP
jgi:hypothetical protein